VNFFGHATVAGWRSNNPSFVFGAMLPDFAAMCGNALREVLDSEVRAGVDMHLATDDVFHRAPIFIDLCSCAVESLVFRGVKRPSARAAAHAGVELMLDGALSGDRVARANYTNALNAGASDQLADKIQWRDPWVRDDWRRLIMILRSANMPQGYCETDFVLGRLVNILARRPKLALVSGSELSAVSRWIEEARPLVEQLCPILLEQVKQGLKI
jgi:hypothetical protein